MPVIVVKMINNYERVHGNIMSMQRYIPRTIFVTTDILTQELGTSVPVEL